jgi:tetratricopeptide (TPR) repeat protein
MELGVVFLNFDLQSFDLQEFFGSMFASLKTWWASVAAAINAARPTVEPIIWVAGSVLALVPGTFAIYKWLYYRRSRLPQRFEEMLLQEERRLKNARLVLLERIQRPESIKPFKAPIFVVPSLAKALRALNWMSWWNSKSLDVADQNLKSALSEIELRLQKWDDNRAHQREQLATALLLRGAIAAARAEKDRAEGMDGDARNREALSLFSKALEIDPTDIEAMEYAAHQHRMLGELDLATALYERLAEQSNRPGTDMAMVRMRALRYQGELFFRKYEVDGFAATLNNRARPPLLEALNIMPQVARGELIEAFARRWLGEVEDERDTAALWVTQYNEAERIFQDLIIRGKDVNEARAGLQEIRTLRDKATRRRQATVADNQRPEPPLASAGLPPAK